MLSQIFTPSIAKEESIHTEQALQLLTEQVKREQGTSSHLQSLFGERTVHSSRSEFLSSKSQTFPTLYMRKPSQAPILVPPLPLQSCQVSLVPSEAPSFQMHTCSESQDPNNLPIHLYANNGLWNPEYLACQLHSVFARTNHPVPNYIALACHPWSELLLLPGMNTPFQQPCDPMKIPRSFSLMF